MKRLILGVIFGVMSLIGFSQYNTPTQFVLLDQTSYGTIRGQINDANEAFYDSLYVYRLIMNSLNYDYVVDSTEDLRADVVVLDAYKTSSTARLVAMEAIDHTHTNSSVLNATTASFTTAQGTALSTATSNIVTLVSDLDIAEATIVDIQSVLDSAVIQFLIVGADTALQSGQQETGYIFAIDESLDGYNLVRMKIYHTGRRTNGTSSCSVFNGTTSMVLASATLTAATRVAASIDGNNDDVAEGDVLNFKYSDTGGAPSRGLNVMLIFKRP